MLCYLIYCEGTMQATRSLEDLLSAIESISIHEVTPVRKLHHLPPINTRLADTTHELTANILQAFKPIICSQEVLTKNRQMNYQNYNAQEPAELFTVEEAELLSAEVAKVFGNGALPGNYVLSRKVSKLDWKVLFPEGQTAFLLLPKKKLFPEVDGHHKCGRVSVLCSQEETAWKVTRLFTLTPTKGHAGAFVKARKVEHKLYDRVGKDLFPICYYDFEMTKNQNEPPTRSCYYESLKSAYYYDQKQDMQHVQQLALSAAKKVAFLA